MIDQSVSTMSVSKHEKQSSGKYDPKEIEPKLQQFWEKEGIYQFKNDKNKKTFSVDTPPPTVSGKMHIGHAFSYSQQDIVVRYQRMIGKNVFFPFGTDDNGLPTEKLVEKKKKILSRKFSREEFVKICNEFISEEKPKFIQSWKDIGMSADFKGSYSTINEHSQITSQASFIDLFKKRKIYQQESPNNWCVSCQTAIAQAEFESIEMKSHFNDIVFEHNSEKLIISTTRPELLPACVALFYNPTDKRYKHLTNKFAKVPLFDYEVPILADESVDKDKGTGLMMVCTFGDKEDVEKWHKFNLPLKVVIEKYGKMNDLAKDFKGLKIKDARQEIINKLKEKKCLINQKEILHAVNVHDRCKTPIEFMKTKQWYIKVLDKKEELLNLANEINWYPKHMKTRYDHWVQNLNWDWCISRQRHFGIPVPIWTCKKCGIHNIPEIKDLPIDPLVNSPRKKCECGSNDFDGETDVLDTWATSSVTPEISSNWVHEGEYKISYKNNEFSLRPQAHDIIRTWLFYTVVKSYHHHNRAPWKDVVISGHAQDKNGRKMSKSLGNIVEPMEMISKYSADALRFWAAGSKLGDDLPFQEKDLLTGQKTVTKLWNASKFSMLHLEDYDSNEKIEITEIFDRWLVSKLQKTIKECTENFEKYEYSKSKSEIEKFFWQILCDNYLEIVKDRLYKPDQRKDGSEKRKSSQKTLFIALLSTIKMMAPIMPFITEEIYQLFFKDNQNTKSIHLSLWPKYDKNLVDEQAEKIGDKGIEIISLVRKYKSENQLSLKEELKELVLISNLEDFKTDIGMISEDLKAVLNVKEIVFKGQTEFKTEQFQIKVGINRNNSKD